MERRQAFLKRNQAQSPCFPTVFTNYPGAWGRDMIISRSYPFCVFTFVNKYSLKPQESVYLHSKRVSAVQWDFFYLGYLIAER